MKDILGQEIKVGEFVVYAVSAMASDLSVGKLLKISQSGRNDYFHIRGYDRDWKWNYETKEKIFLGYILRGKAGRVLGNKRICCIDQNLIPDEAKKLYESL